MRFVEGLRGALPFRFRRQARAHPACEGVCLEETDMLDRGRRIERDRTIEPKLTGSFSFRVAAPMEGASISFCLTHAHPSDSQFPTAR